VLARLSSRVFNRQSVQEAIRSIQSKIKRYRSVPAQGLVVFCGGKISVVFEPPKPMCRSMYWCDDKFHTEYLREQLENHETFGFVIIDGDGASLHTLSGTQKRCLWSVNVNLPKKHGRGGQSKQRFERQREEKRDWYVKIIAKRCVKEFIDQTTNKPKIVGLILAGNADFKTVLSKCSTLDPRLKNVIIRVADIQYGGSRGFEEAIRASSDALSDLEHLKEKKTISDFFARLANDLPTCYGLDDTRFALESGAVETLILWDALPALKTPENWHGGNLNADGSEPLLDWLLEHYSEYGCALQLVSDQSDEASQFVHGFGGIGGTLRYRVQLPSENTYDDCEYDY
jgi:peptide chain release factor subunit 1